MAYNTAIKYLQDTYGVKVLGLTMDAENTLKRINFAIGIERRKVVL